MGNEDVQLVILPQMACYQPQQNLYPLRRWAYARQWRGILELAARYFGDGKLQKQRSGGLGIGNESAGASESPVRHDLG